MRVLLPMLLLLALLAPPVSAREEWYDYYDTALRALDRGDHATAVGLIEAALERKDRSGYLRTYEEIFPRASIRGIKLTASLWETAGRSELDA